MSLKKYLPRGNASEGNGPLGLVIHVAGLAHRVPKTEAEKQAFFDINLE